MTSVFWRPGGGKNCVHVKYIAKLCSPNNIQFQALHIHYQQYYYPPFPLSVSLIHTHCISLGREQYVAVTMV